MKKLTLLLLFTFCVSSILSLPALAQFNITISNAGTVNMPATNVGTVRTFTANATGANLQIADIIAAYTGGITEVRILTGATGGSQDGNITLANPIDYNGIGLGKTLTLTANNSVIIAQNITDGTAGGDLLNLNFTGNGLGAGVSTVAGVYMNATFQTNGGSITAVGTQSDNGAKGIYVEAGTITTNGGSISMTAISNGVSLAPPNTCDGIDYQATTITNGGAITISGTSTNTLGNNGVQVDATLSSGTGAINITAVSNGNATGFVNTLGTVTSTSGNITITGTANSTLLTAVPQVFASGVSIVSPVGSTTGSITINATNNANAPAFFNSTAINNGNITTTSGNITINGTANNNNATAILASGIQVIRDVTTGSGSISFTGISNAPAAGFALIGVTIPAVSNGSIFSTSGDISITGTANNTAGGNGVLLARPFPNGTGKITIIGENNGLVACVLVNNILNATTGDITITGLSKNAGGVTNAAIDVFANITTTTGKINLTGESNGTNVGIFTGGGTIISTSGGDITLNGKNNQATGGGQGVRVDGTLNPNSGKINIIGVSNGNFPAITLNTPLTTTGGDITINGTAKNTTGGAGVFVSQPINSGTGKISLTGESNGNATAVQINNTLTTTGGDITINGKALNTTGVNARGVINTQAINAGTGKITIISENNGDAFATIISGTLTTTGGDITINGTAKNTTGSVAIGIGTFQPINSGTGKITITGESNGNASATSIQNTLTTTSGNVEVIGNAKSTTGNGSGVDIRNPINTGAGKITIIGENNGGVPAVAIWVNGNLTTTTGNVEITGKAKSAVGVGKGVDIRNPIITTSGNVIITGESASEFPGTSLYSNITSTSGSFILKGINSNVTTNSTFPFGIETAGTISTGGNGTISIEGENNANARAIIIFPATTISTVNGNISIKGAGKSTNSTYVNAIGVDVQGLVNVTGTGSISVNGESNANSLALAVFSATTTLRTNTGDINLNGLSRSTIGTVSRAVEILSPMESVNGKINIVGESRGFASAINATFSLINQKDISLLSRRGNITFNNNSFIQSTNGGAIDICVAPTYNLVVTGATSGNSIQTTGGAPIGITNGGNGLAVGNATNLVGLISNGTNTLSAGTYTNANLGSISIKSNLQVQAAGELIANTLNGFIIILRISDLCTSGFGWANPLNPANFTLANVPAGTSIRSVFRSSETEVAVTLAYNGTEDIIDLAFPLAQLTTLGTAFNPISPSVSFPIPIGAGQFLPVVLKGTAGSQSVNLEWDAVFGARSYEIFGYSAGQPQQLLGSTSDTKFTVTGLKNATTYFFRAVALTATGRGSGFSNTVELRPSIILGTEEETLNQQFQVYPNPSNGNFTLQSSQLKGKRAEISVMDLSGRIIYLQSVNLSGALDTNLQLNIAGGVYLLQVTTEKDTYKRKLVVENY